MTDNTTLTPILLARRFPGVVLLLWFVLRLEPDRDGGRIIESVEVGRERTLPS